MQIKPRYFLLNNIFPDEFSFKFLNQKESELNQVLKQEQECGLTVATLTTTRDSLIMTERTTKSTTKETTRKTTTQPTTTTTKTTTASTSRAQPKTNMPYIERVRYTSSSTSTTTYRTPSTYTTRTTTTTTRTTTTPTTTKKQG
jgi:hypothetical protein